jgi:hypothetical protein
MNKKSEQDIIAEAIDNDIVQKRLAYVQSKKASGEVPSQYTHFLHFSGASSTPKAYLKKSDAGHELYDTKEKHVGTFKSLSDAKKEAIKKGLL